MPYCIHLRKSRADLEAEARGEGESLQRHRKRLLDLAQRMGLDIVAEYCELISGDKLSDRPEMQRLLNDVAAGMYDGVLDVEISRLTRGDLMDQGRIINTFKYSSTKIITPEHTYDLSEDWDEDVITSDMMMARREYKYIKKRLQRGRLASASEGLWQSPAPFGYRKIKIQRGKGWTLEPDPDTAPLVRMIFDLYANEGAGGAKIAERLNALGSVTPKGNPWTAGAIGKLSQNPVYIGKVRWNDRVSITRIVDGQLVVRREKCGTPIISDGKHPAIVPMELWEAAQRSRKSHDKTRKHSSVPARNPLAGLVYCAVCGKSMIRKDNGNANGSKYDLLRCTTPGCPTVATALSIVEQAIINTLSAWLTAYSASDAGQTALRVSPRKEAISAARANLQRLTAQRDRIFAAYEDGAYDAQTFVARRSAKDAEIASAEQAIHDLERETVSAEDAIIAELPEIRTALDLYKLATDPMDKNKILKHVISRVEYQKTVRCYRNQDPASELTLTIYPIMPVG